MSVDSPGSAFLSIALYHREEGFEDTLNAARDGLKQNFEAFGTVVVEEYTDNFAETDFKGYRLTVKAFGIPHTNCVVGAIVNGKTVIISWQYADEDLEQFGKDIDLIKGSLAISK